MAETNQSLNTPGHKYVNFDEYVDFHLVKAQTSIKANEIITVLVGLAAGVLTYILAFVILDQWVLAGGFSDSTRIILSSSVLLIVLGVLAVRVAYPLLKRVHPLYAAQMLERAEPSLKSNLLNLVDVREAHASGEAIVLRAMEKRAAVELSHVDVEQAVDRRKLLHFSYVLLAAVLVSCLYAIFSPKDLFTSMRRALFPTSPVAVPTQTTIADVTPGDVRVPARSRLTVEADVRGRRPSQVTLYYTTADRKFVDEAVEMRLIDEHGARYRGMILGENGRGLMQDVTYRLEAGDYRTNDYAVTVIQPPSTRVEEVKYLYPAYTQLGEKTQTGIANIDAWEGTTVRVRATANMPVKSARIRRTDTESLDGKGEELALQIKDGVHLEGEWKLAFRSDGTAPRFYHLEIKTTSGESDPDPTHYSLRIRPDQPPEVTLLSPNTNLQKPANAIIPLVIQATDPDFQLRFLTLKVERKGEQLPDQTLFEGQTLGQSFRGAEQFDLKRLGLSRGDKLQFWIEAKDNRQPSANRSVTPRLTIDIVDPVTPEEVRQQLAEDRRQASDQVAMNNSELNEKTNTRSPAHSEEKPPTETPNNPRQPAPENPGKVKQDKPEQAPTGDEPPGQKPSANQGDKSGDTRQTPASDEDAMQKLVQDELASRDRRGKPDEDPSQVQPDEPDQTPPSEKPKNSRKPSPKKNGDKNPPPSPPEKKDPKKADDQNKQGSGTGSQSESEGDESSGEDQKPERKQTQTGKDSTGKSTGDNSKSKGTTKGKNSKSGTTGKGGSDSATGKADSDDPPSGKSPAAAKNASKTGSQEAKKGGDRNGNQSQPKKGNGQPQQTGTGEPQTGDSDKTKPGNEKGKKPPQGSQGTGDHSADSDPDPQQRGKSQGKPPQGTPSGNEPPAGQDSATPQKTDSPPKPGNNSRTPEQGADGNQTPQPSGKPDATSQKNSPDSDGSAGDQSPSSTPPDKNGSTGKSRPSASEPSQKPSQGGESSGSDDQQGKNSSDEQRGKNGTQGGDPKSGGKTGAGNPKPGSTRGNAPDSTGDREPGAEKKGSAGSPPENSNPGGDPTGNQTQPGKNSPDRKPRAAREGTGSDTQPENPAENPKGEPASGKNTPRKTGKRPPNGNDQVASNDPATGEDATAAKKGKSASRRPPTPGNDTSPEQPTPPDGTPNGSETGTGSESTSDKKASSKTTGKPSSAGNGKKQGAGKSETGKEQASPKQGSNDNTKNQSGGDSKDPPSSGSPDKTGSGKSGGGKSSKGGSSPGKSDGGEPSSGGKAQGGAGKAGQGGSKPGGPAQPDSGSGSGDPGGTPGDGASGKGGDQAPGNDAPNGGDHGGGGSRGGSGKAGQGDSAPGGDAANLDFARQATELVLKRLQGDLERGQVDPQLLKELGWTEDRMAQFVQRMQEQLKDRGEDPSPEAVARRLQFEETLKNLQLTRAIKKHSGETSNKRRTQHIQAREVPVPPEYRESYNSYTKSLSKSPAAK